MRLFLFFRSQNSALPEHLFREKAHLGRIRGVSQEDRELTASASAGASTDSRLSRISQGSIYLHILLAFYISSTNSYIYFPIT